jgi:hypothetical protein
VSHRSATGASSSRSISPRHSRASNVERTTLV